LTLPARLCRLSHSMLIIFWVLFSSLRNSLLSRAALQAEILALRHQLPVLQRSTPGRRPLSAGGSHLLGLAVSPVARLAFCCEDHAAGDCAGLGA
jgi:hypothetical protein